MTAVLAGLLVAAVLAFVLWTVSVPLRRAAGAAGAADRDEQSADSDERRALESARESKYAEIRDNETDYRTGKLSEEDYHALDAAMRAEAVEILRQIDEHEARAGREPAPSR